MSDTASATSERVQARAERWSGRITDDERLLGELPEDLAADLVNWGVDAVAAFATRTASLDDDAAEPVLDAGLRVVKGLIETIGEVAKAHGEDDTAVRDKGLSQVARAAADPALRSVIVDGKQRTVAAR